MTVEQLAPFIVPLAGTLVAGLLLCLLFLLATRRFAAQGGHALGARLEEAENELAELQRAKGDLERKLSEEGRRLAGLEVTASRLPELERQLGERQAALDALRSQKAAVESELAVSRETARERGEQVAALKAALEEARAELAGNGRVLADQRSKIATLEETVEQERRRSEEKLKLLSDARETMTKEFKLLADEVMKNHGASFAQQNKEQVEGILKPLRERIQEFQQGLQTAHTESAKERATLAEQITRLTVQSTKMSSETENLTRALKGKAQTQGAWGEMILSSILERSGLREGEEYSTQDSHTTEDGRRLRSDVLVSLPGGQRVVVDSKVSLTAFEEYVNLEEEAPRLAALTRHVVSLKGHIKELGSKDYHLAAGSALDYVIMFVPIEGALAVALQQDPAITAFAVDNNVAIATPTTLMVALRTIANVWQVERRNRNAEEIATRAGRLYDKFVGFAGDMQTLGDRLDSARKTYDGAMGKLTTGNGNLVRQVETLKELGAKASKSIPQALREEAGPQGADQLPGERSQEGAGEESLSLPGMTDDAPAQQEERAEEGEKVD